MKTKVCPACGSKDIELDTDRKFAQATQINIFTCRKCGYRGPMAETERRI
jgi:predicted RNA-binding Zn-ribbon protein involved in translation (DUF1610 family)